MREYRKVQFNPAHGRALIAQKAQRIDLAGIEGTKEWEWDRLLLRGFAFTGFEGSRMLVCCGIIPYWHGRAAAWALIASGVDRHDMLWMHRMGLQILDDAQVDPAYTRLEASVVEDFAAGHRWVRMLGFIEEATAERYDPSGRTCVLYSRIRPCQAQNCSSPGQSSPQAGVLPAG